MMMWYLYPDDGRKDDAIVITREESLDLQEDICRSRDLSFHLVLSEKQKYENKKKWKCKGSVQAQVRPWDAAYV